jgi:hypothetical protein
VADPSRGWLRPGQVHTVGIVRAHSDVVLFEVQVMASRFGSWQEMFSTMNHRVPVLPIEAFPGLDLAGMVDLDSGAALPLTAGPLPPTVVAYAVTEVPDVSDLSDVAALVVELPEPLPPELALDWLDAAGEPLDLPAPMIRSDRTRFAWRAGRDVLAPARLRVALRRPGCFAGEPATVEAAAQYPIELTQAPT